MQLQFVFVIACCLYHENKQIKRTFFPCFKIKLNKLACQQIKTERNDLWKLLYQRCTGWCFPYIILQESIPIGCVLPAWRLYVLHQWPPPNFTHKFVPKWTRLNRSQWLPQDVTTNGQGVPGLMSQGVPSSDAWEEPRHGWSQIWCLGEGQARGACIWIMGNGHITHDPSPYTEWQTDTYENITFPQIIGRW